MNEGSTNGVGRRTWLECVGGAAMLAGLAGCVGDYEDVKTLIDPSELEMFGDDRDLPAYASAFAVPEEAPADDPNLLLSLNMEVFDGDTDEETETPTPTPTPETDDVVDPLVNNPFIAVIAIGVVISIGITETGLSDLVDTDRDTPTETITIAEDRIILVGEFDPNRIASDVQDAGLAELETIGEFTLYGDGDGTGVAVGSEYVFPILNGDDDDDVRKQLGRVIETTEGERERYHETREDIEWLLRTAGEGDLVVGRFTEADRMELPEADGGLIETDNEMYEGARGVVQFLDLDSDAEEAHAKAAFVYDDASLVDTEWLESRAGFTADEQEVSVQDEKVIVEAFWHAD